MPVIAMSAHVFSEEVDQYLAAGMNGFLGKPFSLNDLQLAMAGACLDDGVVIARSGQAGKMRSIAPINPAIIEDDLKRLGRDRVGQFAGLFFRSADELRDRLVESMRRAAFASQQNLAHKLCGSAGNFGLEKLCDLLSRIEQQAKNNEPASGELIDRLQATYAEAIEALGTHLEQTREAESESSPEDRQDLRASR